MPSYHVVEPDRFERSRLLNSNDQNNRNSNSDIGNSDSNNNGELVFNHFDQDELDDQPLPGSIYSATMVSVLGLSSEDISSWGNLFKSAAVILPQWGILTFNYIFSLIVVINIRALRDETPVCEADLTLLTFGVGVFNIYNVGEILETLTIAQWINRFPTAQKHEPLTFSSDGEDKEIVSGMTIWFKMWCYLTIVIPKLLIGLLISFYGSGFLWTSDDNESVILNTMALTFITQTDELIYQYMVPRSLQNILEEIPPQKLSHGLKLFHLFRPYYVSAGVVLTTYVTYQLTCTY